MARRSRTVTLNKTNPTNPGKTSNSQELHQRIQKKAFELYTKRGYGHGSDLKDWLEAERIVLSELRRS